MKKNRSHCMRIDAIRRSLAFFLAVVILVQQMGVQASVQEAEKSITEVSTGVAAVSAGNTAVSSKDAEVSSGDAEVSSGDALPEPQEPESYEFQEEEYCIELSAESGTCGSVVEAKLKYLGTGNCKGVKVIWKSDSGKLSPITQQSASGDFLSAQTYEIIANEASTQKISAQLYHDQHFLGTVESGDFLLKKDSGEPLIKEVSYAIGQQPLKNLTGTEGIHGCGDLTLRIKAEDVAGKGTDEAVSGIHTVWVEINGIRHDMAYDTDAGVWKTEIDMPESVYSVFTPTICAIDKANNRKLKKLPCFYIDREQPELEVSLRNGRGRIDGWYSEALHGENLSIRIDVNDKSTIEKIEVSENADFSTVLETITNIEKTENYSYKAQTAEGLIRGEQNRKYYVRAFDKWGNSATESIQVSIDNIAPKDEVLVEFYGTENMQVLPDDTKKGSHTYILSGKQGCVYDKKEISLVLVMEDGISNKAVSGIETVKFLLLVRDGREGNVTRKRVQLTSKDFYIREDGSTGASYTLGIPDSDVFEKSFQICDLFITDKAGNVCPGGVEGMQDHVLYYVDNSAPRVEYTYGTAEAGEGNIEELSGERIRYFNQPYAASLTVEDDNLIAVEVTNAAVEGNQQAELIRLAKEADAPIRTQETYQYTLNGDGRYRLCVKADDILHNGMKQGKMTEILSDSIVVDSIAPKLELEICNDKGEVESGYTSQYYAHDMIVQMRIEEPYLDMDTVSVLISGIDGDGEVIAITLEPDSWTADGFVYTNQYRITTEGYYSVSVSCKDKAGNSSEKTAGGIYINKTAPKVNITYDKNEPLNQFYYNTVRTATVTVQDRSFDAAGAQFEVKAAYGSQPVISEWTHHPGKKCDGSRHTGSCTYTATVRFDKDDIYDFTFSCMNKAGLKSEAVKEEHFVIDRTAPVISVTFDHYEASHDYFYNQARTAYIQVEEISFDENLVAVAKSESMTADNLPSLSGFSENGKTHTASMCFEEDGTYQFTAEAEDLAGNKAEIQICPLFILDRTAPEVSISGVKAFSANKGKVTPRIEYHDTYLSDAESVFEISGYYHGSITGEFTKEAVPEGYQISYADFPHTQDTDDLYTLDVRIKDYAGNETTETLVFSVNRFGSVYVLSEKSAAAIENYYLTQAPEIVLTEINVDRLEQRQITLSLDGVTTCLTEGGDYTVQQQGTDVTWKSYSYSMPAENFEMEGHYAITVSSTDKAKNTSDNKSKGTEITFAVDKTAPSIVVSGVESNGFYEAEELTVRADMKDNMGLGYAAVYDGSRLLQEYDADALEENFGEITFCLKEGKETRDISIVAQDLAGNVQEQLYQEVTVTNAGTADSRRSGNSIPKTASVLDAGKVNKMMRIPWFAILGVSVLIAGTGGVFFVKRRSLKSKKA